jgi:ribonuclease BN (tRNA processing enzyme)
MKLLSRAMSPPLFPVRFEELKAEIAYGGDCPIILQIDSIEIVPITLSHPNMGYGYKFVEDGKTFVFITDNELGFKHRGGREFDEYVEFARDADILIHDAEYTPEQYKETKTWGHSTYVEALNLAIAAQVKRFGLFHHNQNRSDAEIDSIVEECQKIIKINKENIECFAIFQGQELTL